MIPFNSSEAWLTLTLAPGLGPRRMKKLVDFFGDIQSVIQASEKELRQVPGIDTHLTEKILKTIHSNQLEKELKWIQEYGLNYCDISDQNYPKLLQEIYDPPPILYKKGDFDLNSGFPIAIVGSRKATYYGKDQTTSFVKQLAEISSNIVIISGLALGIDAVAHQAALECGLKTVAVLGGGLSNIYPPQHRELSERIAQNGALVTEFSVMSRPVAANFPLRNRVISGLSKGTFVVEAGEKSGALITAHCCLDHNRELFALPGQVNVNSCKGTNRLIQKGNAKLVLEAKDILEEFAEWEEPTQLSFFPPEKKEIDSLSQEEQKILSLLQGEGVHIDFLVQKTDFPVAKLMVILSTLEMKELAIKKVGSLYQSLV